MTTNTILPKPTIQTTTFFGVDLGNSLAKIVYFEADPQPVGQNGDGETEASRVVRQYLTSRSEYPLSGERSDALAVRGITLNHRKGTLHFIRFPVIEVANLIALIKEQRVRIEKIS